MRTQLRDDVRGCASCARTPAEARTTRAALASAAIDLGPILRADTARRSHSTLRSARRYRVQADEIEVEHSVNELTSPRKNLEGREEVLVSEVVADRDDADVTADLPPCPRYGERLAGRCGPDLDDLVAVDSLEARVVREEVVDGDRRLDAERRAGVRSELTVVDRTRPRLALDARARVAPRHRLESFCEKQDGLRVEIDGGLPRAVATAPGPMLGHEPHGRLCEVPFEDLVRSPADDDDTEALQRRQ
jgi:hypothetical protein